MTDGGWSRVREVFEQACELEPDQLDAFLATSCAEDAATAAEVRELLLASAAAADTLEPASGPELIGSLGSALVADVRAPSQIGSYRLREPLASGGMGVVFLAEQDQPRRRVALKMLRLGFESDDAIRRFRYESELLASLRHPGIAQVYEAGVHRIDGEPPRDVPWFAMEFVEDATTILGYAHDRELDTRARLELFRSVCAAVHHGHQRGVVHRDLKPDNLLVDGGGHVKVIDFGVARSLDADARFTMPPTDAGRVVGTLQYMSPEQLAGVPADVDTRSDVFALGVVLFELLTGHLPHDVRGKAIHEVAAAVRERPPRRLREFSPALAGDLELIVGKALAKDPDRRYGSAAALGDDLERFLGDEPIAARPPSLAYQAQLFGRRHRALAGAIVFAAAAAVVATVVSVRSAMEASTARASSEALFRQFVARSLEQTFEFAPRIHRLPGAAPISTDMIERTISDLEMLERQPLASGAMRVDLIAAYTRLGEVQGLATSPNLGEVDAAGVSLRRAVELADALLASGVDDRPALLAHARATRMLGQWHQQIGESATARDLLEDAVASSDRLRDAAMDDLGAGLECGHAHEMLSRTLYAQDDLDAADAHCDAAAKTFAGLYAAHPENDEIEFRFVTSRNAMVNSFYRRGLAAERDGRAADAGPWYERSRAQSRGTIAAIAEHYGDAAIRKDARIWMAGALRWSGSMSLLLDELDGATDELGRALAYYREFAAADPDDPRWPPVLGDVLTSLGNVERTRAQQELDLDARRRCWSAARDHYRESLGLWRALEAAGQLRGPRTAIPADVSERLASCESALRELGDGR